MAKFIYTGEEYVNADHIVYIDAPEGDKLMFIYLDTGIKLARQSKYLMEILKFVNN